MFFFSLLCYVRVQCRLFTTLFCGLITARCSSPLRRILSLDTNKQQIVALSEEGVHASSLSVGAQFRVFWPHQLRCFERAAADNRTLPLVDVYLAGYLGECNVLFLVVTLILWW